MTNSEMDDGTAMDNGTTRDDLVQRVALMEAMIAEGRKTTGRYGWVFLMWGLLYFVATGWVVFLPFPQWAWPVCIVVGFVTSGVVQSRRRRTGTGEDLRLRSIEAVWKSMGIAITLFAIAAVVSHSAGGPIFVAALLFFIGLAHSGSAMILRWPAQGLIAVVWWACGVASFFFTTPSESVAIFLAASFFGMILFGVYVMVVERRRASRTVQRHA